MTVPALVPGAPAVGGAVVGALLGLGVWLTAVGIATGRRVDLVDRLAPYLRDTDPASRRRDGWPGRPALGPLGRLLAPVAGGAARGLERLAGGPGTVEDRLDRSGSAIGLDQFRAEQVLWGVAGLGAGGATAAVVGATQGPGPAPLLATVLAGSVAGALARDQHLSRQVRRREERMMLELPAVAELLALSVAAGESAAGALDRVVATSGGELAAELRRALADARAGTPLVASLEALARRTGVPPVARFLDGVVVALERGTPLAEVLWAQAQDVRDLSRRRLLETGGRKEIAMMVPVVFLVLPVTVLFAVYPGLVALDLQL